jgi:hypothetical protein
LPPFGFDDRKPETIAFPFFGKGVCFRLGGGVLEQNAVRNVLASSSGKVLLPEIGRPAEPDKDRPDQVIFGLRLVWRRLLRGRKLRENSAKISGQGVDFGVGQKLPVRNALDRFPKEVGGEQASLGYVFGCHALGVPCPVV